MRRHGRKAAFVLAAADHGTMIVNRLDWIPDRPGYAIGVCCELLEHSVYESKEVDLAVGLLMLRREYYGPGVIAIDGGANIGVHTIEWAKAMSQFGQVVAFEPQERIFYALAGNIVINNCHNAFALQKGLGERNEVIEMPVPDYTRPGSFGGLELKSPPILGQVGTGQEPIEARAPVEIIRLDSLAIPRCDFIKLDLEGMELDALKGGAEMIEEFRPALLVEHIKSGMDNVVGWAREHDYEAFQFAGNMVCVHRLDKLLDHVRHLHRALLRQQVGAGDMNLEWLKFGRPDNEEAA